MKYFKFVNFVFFILIVFSCNFVFGQNTFIKNNFLRKEENSSEINVIKHETIVLDVGTLEIETVFVYKDEITPYQGYLIKFKDFLRIDDLAKNFNTGNEILLNAIVEEYEIKLLQCQNDCNQRIDEITIQNDLLKKEIDKKEKIILKEIKNKYIWSTFAIFGGAGLGMLLNNAINK